VKNKKINKKKFYSILTINDQLKMYFAHIFFRKKYAVTNKM